MSNNFRGKIYENLTDAIGKTPLVYLKKISNGLPGIIVGKVESFNPLNSVKCRIGIAMIEDAEKNNKVKKGGTIIEATSGNTGIGLAYASQIKGYKLIIVMPETMSIERRKILKMLGAELVLTPGNLGMNGAVKKAKELNKQIKNSFIPSQFENPANPDIHRKTTAIEIWEDTFGKVDIFISGVGTGGTITGVSEILKEKNSNIKSIAVEPDSSAVLSGDKPGPHKIQGIGAGFIPKILNRNIIDEVIRITNEEAFEYANRISKEEGILVGISSGAAVAAAVKVASREENKGKIIVVMLPDSGERYITTQLSDV